MYKILGYVLGEDFYEEYEDIYYDEETKDIVRKNYKKKICLRHKCKEKDLFLSILEPPKV